MKLFIKIKNKIKTSIQPATFSHFLKIIKNFLETNKIPLRENSKKKSTWIWFECIGSKKSLSQKSLKQWFLNSILTLLFFLSSSSLSRTLYYLLFSLFSRLLFRSQTTQHKVQLFSLLPFLCSICCKFSVT